MTQDYYGTKRITAWAEERDGQPGYAVRYDHGYTSWSPKDVFEAAYQPLTHMSFGHAIEAMKAGHKVARSGWNGKGMWIALTPGYAFEARHAKCGHAAAKRAVELDDPEAEIELLPHIDMRTADGSICVGWLASQTDMLADDWTVVEG
ncbi:DUF2829 domain-containing protein [Cereibacter azotoformans]|uniref:DUF2829 domain-containing protein n=1 Tax=Cereibacter azotoformans TaxID=43057 RepID=UPI000C6CE31C|nr:DUF2829 domain-containing protein [Cereibacter azotoformans]